METVHPKMEELFRISLTSKEAYGVRNCRGSMWHSYAGGLCRARGHELPGTHMAELSDANELIIKAQPYAAAAPQGEETRREEVAGA